MITWINNSNIDLLRFTILNDKTLWIPIISDMNCSPNDRRVSFIYIYGLATATQYVVNFNHNDADCINSENFYSQMVGGVKYVYNYRYVYDLIPDGTDIELYLWYYNNRRVDISIRQFTTIVSYFKRFSTYSNVVDCIPIMKLIEYCQVLRNDILAKYVESDCDQFDTYRAYIQCVYEIERAGIRLNTKLLPKYFKRLTTDSMIYVTGNPYTSTGRPVFQYNGVTFNSLNKTSGERAVVVSRFPGGRLVEFDYDSYHIRLAALLVNADLPTDNIHEHFAKLYFKTREVTPDQYEAAKHITFKQMYGTPDIEYKSIKFFTDIESYRVDMFSKYMTDGFVETPGGRKLYASWFGEMNENKLFSYIIQSFETEINSMILGKILDYLLNRKSKLIMYTFDSFLFDYCPEDGQDTLKELRDIIISFGFPTKMSVGFNYHDMVGVTI